MNLTPPLGSYIATPTIGTGAAGDRYPLAPLHGLLFSIDIATVRLPQAQT